jgi:hypothetical protein
MLEPKEIYISSLTLKINKKIVCLCTFVMSDSIFYNIIYFCYHIIFIPGLYCGNILNSPPPSFFFILSPQFLEWFQQAFLFHFHTWVHSISITFLLLHPFLISSPLLLVPTPRQDLFYFPVLHFFKKGILFV